MAVAESKAPGLPERPSTSFWGLIRAVSSSVLSFSTIGS